MLPYQDTFISYLLFIIFLGYLLRLPSYGHTLCYLCMLTSYVTFLYYLPMVPSYDTFYVTFLGYFLRLAT